MTLIQFNFFTIYFLVYRLILVDLGHRQISRLIRIEIQSQCFRRSRDEPRILGLFFVPRRPFSFLVHSYISWDSWSTLYAAGYTIYGRWKALSLKLSIT
jgi:hypothetical protein